MFDLIGISPQALFGQLLIGLINGSFYATMSLGIAIIFGMLRIANFVHGAQYMMGAFAAWLQASNLNPNDAILVLSVGGGDESRGISVNLIRAIEFARSTGSAVLAILGRPDGFAAIHADVAVVLPASAPTRLTPHAEAFQAVIWHCIVSDPRLQTNSTTW